MTRDAKPKARPRRQSLKFTAAHKRKIESVKQVYVESIDFEGSESYLAGYRVGYFEALRAAAHDVDYAVDCLVEYLNDPVYEDF